MNHNKNPLNIKQVSPDAWAHSVGADGRGHAIFADPAHGVRAAMRSLQRKWDNGKRTLIQIIADWAPASDTVGSIAGGAQNDPIDYARYVAARAGCGVGESLLSPASNPHLWLRIVRAMAYYEMGEECPWSVVLRGMGMWFEDFIERR